ncbi:MAG: phage tail sheath subtilisin-like domain-containing protein [Anaerolineae bacterium]|nr:phage tail sheath subtilisin-like domain-containing protein [Anaerolineae bacterium]
MLSRQRTPATAETPEPLTLPDMNTAAFLGQTARGPFWPQQVTNWREFVSWFGGHTSFSCLAYAVDGFFRNGGQRCYIVRVVPADARIAALTSSTLQIQAIGPGAWGNRIAVRIRETGSGRFRLTVRYWDTEPPSDFVASRPRVVPDMEESYDHLSPDPRSPDYVLARLARGQSRLIVVRWENERRRGFPRPRDFAFLRDGADGSPVTVADFEGGRLAPPEERRGLAALQDIPDIGLVAAPDDTGGLVVQAAVIAHCSTPLLFRFGIVGGQPEALSLDMVTAPRDTSHAAIYYPWLEVLDPLTKAPKLVPPVGHVAGILARLGRQQGLHTSPAGQTIQGILGTQLLLRDTDSAQLAEQRVNAIRDLSARGGRIVLDTACTMSGAAPWRALHVRRLVNGVEKAMVAGTGWAVGRVNDERLWDSLRAQVTTFLDRLWRSGVLQGNRAEDAYFVHCGRDTMADEDVAEDRGIVEVGLAVEEPREFVSFRLVQSPAGPQVIEAL